MYIPLVILTFAFLAGRALAQTQSQIQGCANTIQMISYQDPVSYDVKDNTHYFNATWTYGATACTSPARVPVTKITLRNDDAGILTTCDLHQFDSTGILYSQCSTTLGSMAVVSQEYPDSLCAFFPCMVGYR